MNRAFATSASQHWVAAVLLSLVAGLDIANAQTGAPMEALRHSTLSTLICRPGQSGCSLPGRFGRLAEKKGRAPAIRHYAHLMVTSHIPVADALTAICNRKKRHSVKHAVARRFMTR